MNETKFLKSVHGTAGGTATNALRERAKKGEYISEKEKEAARGMDRFELNAILRSKRIEKMTNPMTPANKLAILRAKIRNEEV